MAIEARDLPRRSKVVAGIISSLLPGSGQLYGGEIEDGVTAMIVTGLAGLGTWYAYRDDQYLWTGVAGLGAVALYVKQIGDGVRAADNFNTQKLEDWRHELHASSVLHVDLSEGEGETLELEIELGEIE
jgi:TM2 domain-containing membrane protein YozV